MSIPGAKTTQCRSATLELEIAIEAAPAQVWKAFTNEIDEWWLPDFRVTGSPRGVVFESQVGGRVYEDQGDGQGLLWFHVLSLAEPASMHLAGQICPPFGGPATTQLYVTLEESASGTLLKITNALVGNIDESTVETTREGWRMLFEQGLRQWVEKGRKQAG